MDVPESLWSRVLLWLFERVFRGRHALYEHRFRELAHFKRKLESA